ncbi:hypothetical protein EJ04DRAFT_454341 [Polyplosphaeria fusca]|uniref:N-acetyltransferase domain-containing protein n=1 Tax=Polyplosphaeria fusca TaxID=682080 RepID=A0A9P4RCK5_9PLEO|nr:hypothetical protein EJ04DRAFT_454341 [Polyplosphaeria fusca]
MPPFDNIRLATLEDLPRIATVAAAGFFWSPTFQFQRPHHASFPEDTLSSYWRCYLSELQDPAAAVLVAEDVGEQDERSHVYDALRHSPMYDTLQDGRARVVVGVCSIDLKPESWRMGQFSRSSSGRGADHQAHVDPPGHHVLYNTLDRDFSDEAYAVYNQMTGPAKKKYLAGKMKLTTLAVHPAYWRRGHATNLVSWCVRLADMDGVSVAVSAAPMGARVAVKAGFEEQEVVRIKRSTKENAAAHLADHDIGDVELWIAIRRPLQAPSGGSSTSNSPRRRSL